MFLCLEGQNGPCRDPLKFRLISAYEWNAQSRGDFPPSVKFSARPNVEVFKDEVSLSYSLHLCPSGLLCSWVHLCFTRSPHYCCNIHYRLLTDPRCVCVCVLVHVSVCTRMCLCLCVCLWNPQIKVALLTGHSFLKVLQPKISSSMWNSSCLFASLFEIHRIIKVKAWRCLRD